METLMEKAIKSAGGIKEFNRKFNDYCKNDDYVNNNREQLLKRYDGKWIAIHNSRLTVSGNTWKDVMDKIQSKGLPDDEVVVHFISSKPKILIL